MNVPWEQLEREDEHAEQKAPAGVSAPAWRKMLRWLRSWHSRRLEPLTYRRPWWRELG